MIMDVQFALVIMILAVTVGSVAVALWKKARRPADSCGANCGCGSGTKTVHSGVGAPRT